MVFFSDKHIQIMVEEMTLISKLRDFIADRFNQPTKKSSRREFSTDSIAEFWCTVSNIGFFIVGIYFGDITLLLAGTFSLVSHAIPKQGIHDLDMLGVLLIGVKILLNISVVIANPALLAIGAIAVSINILDTIVTRNFYNVVGPWIHVAWHLTAAAAMFALNNAIQGIPLSLAAISMAQLLPAIVIASVIVAASVYIIPKITAKFFPDNDNQSVSSSVTCNEGERDDNVHDLQCQHTPEQKMTPPTVSKPLFPRPLAKGAEVVSKSSMVPA